MSFVKLYGTILTSTIWGESHTTVRVWITMLALANKDGIVEASVPGLAHFAHVTLEECEEALRVLSAPDPYSKNPSNEGRRVDKVAGGWLILNHGAYREVRTDKQLADAERQKRHRTTVTRNKRSVTPVTRHKSHAPSQGVATDAEAEADTDNKGQKLSAPVGAATAKYPNFPIADSQRFHRTCLEHGHAVDMGVLRKTIAPLYPNTGPIYSTDQLDNALEAFLEAREGQPPDKARFWTLRDFAQDTARWVRLGAMPRSDENGVTERGRLAVGA